MNDRVPNDRVPAEVFSPGEYLKDELDARGWTQLEFAEIIGRSPRLVNEIIAGKRGITPSTAKEIAAALGTTALFWLNLESTYQLRNGEPAPARIAQEARLRERFPVREMIRRGWITPSESPDVLESRVLRFFRIEHIDHRPAFAHAAKKSQYSDDIRPTRDAWLFRVRQIAETMQTGPYSEDGLRAALETFKAFRRDVEDVRHVPRVLTECGVRFVIVEPLPGSKIDGVCFWLEGTTNRPVIGMSLRLDRIDNFWFVLRHEIEHVLRGDGKNAPVVDENVGSPGLPDGENSVLLPEEAAANCAAVEFCVPQAELNDFIARVHNMYWESRIPGFADQIKIHPGLVVGQLQRRSGQWSLLRRSLVKVRNVLVPAAMTDGYGQSVPIQA